MAVSAHAVPGWFGEQRYGMFMHANIASMPAFAPVHPYDDWYWSHWSEHAADADEVTLGDNEISGSRHHDIVTKDGR